MMYVTVMFILVMHCNDTQNSRLWQIACTCTIYTTPMIKFNTIKAKYYNKDFLK